MPKLNPLAAAIGAAVVSSSVSLSALATENPFQSQDLQSGYQLADSSGKDEMEGRCGEKSEAEGKCGSKEETEGKCGEEGEKGKAEGKCGEGKCGEKGHDEKEAAEGKCGGKG
jgi:uncharacterized low-complexity protein